MLRYRRLGPKSVLIYILLIIGILKFCFFTNVIIPSFDSYEYLIVAKALWYTHSPLINLGINNFSFAAHEFGYPLLITIFYPLFHDFELSARFVTVMASILSIFLVYLLMEKIKIGSGKYAAFILATSSLHLFCSSNILRDIISLCFILFILYCFYPPKAFPVYKIIILGLLIGYASLVHLSNVFLLLPFLYLILKKRRFYGLPILLGSYSLVMGPYLYLRIFKWPWTSIENYYRGIYATILFDYFKDIFLRYMRLEPLILIFGLAGIIIILRKNIARQQLVNKFWGIYVLSDLFIFFVWFIKVRTFGDSYLFPLFFPLILTGSIYFDNVFKNNLSSTRQLRIKWIGASLITLYLVLLHWKFVELFIKKIGLSNLLWLKWGLLSLALLLSLSIFSIRPFYKKISLHHIIVVILIAFSIQILDEVRGIKGRHIMTTRGKELSPEINALKGKVLPEEAFFVGVEDGMAILYHTGYPVFDEEFDRMASLHTLGRKWTNKNMVRIINLSKLKPVICVYDHLYRYYLTGMGIERYEAIQENYQENLIFSNLKLNVKIYVLNNTSKEPDYVNAIKHFTTRLQENPYDINLLNYLGWAYFCSGNFDQAIETWRKKISLSQDEADGYNNIGLAYARKGEYQQAIREYEKALKFKPLEDPYRLRWAKAMIYFNLAQAFEKIADRKNAIESWKNFYNSIPYPENYEIMERHIKKLGVSRDIRE